MALAAPGAGLAQTPAAPAVPPSGQARPRPSITIPRAAQPPNIDDFLTLGADDGALPTAVATARGLRIDGFLQREPGDLVPVSEPTTAYLSCDATNLYVVFVCRVSSPSRLRARMARRESVFSDDFVAVMLDTFNDGSGRTCSCQPARHPGGRHHDRRPRRRHELRHGVPVARARTPTATTTWPSTRAASAASPATRRRPPGGCSL